MTAATVPLGPAGTGARRPVGRWLDRARFYLPAIVVFVGVLVIWELAVGASNLQAFIFPRPSAIAAALRDNWTGDRFNLSASFVATMTEAVLGLVLGTLVGVVVAFVTMRFALSRSILLPIAVAANAIPIIAFAPLVNTWFGILSPVSKGVMAAILVFFPVMANVSRGLVQVEPAALELMRSYAASEWTILRKVRVPNALPYFFTALKLATTLSLIGAIVGEYFGGQTFVIGRMIVQSASALKFEITWAAIILGAGAGIGLYLLTVVLERIFIPWHASLREG